MNPFPFLDPPVGPGDLGQLPGLVVRRLIAEGGMGYVFEATTSEGRVAVKVMRSQLAADPRALLRFRREAEAMAAIRHPGVVQVLAVSAHRGHPFLVMELVEGDPLDRWLKKRSRLPQNEVLAIARGVTHALAAAHALGVVHRDLKPANVIMTPGGPKLLDFGLARPAVDPAPLTQSSLLLGTPAYMAPELFLKEPADERSDLYSLGVLLYRMTTNRLPYTATTAVGQVAAFAAVKPDAPAALNPEVSAELDRLITRLMAREPADRPQSAAEVLADLDTLPRRG